MFSPLKCRKNANTKNFEGGGRKKNFVLDFFGCFFALYQWNAETLQFFPRAAKRGGFKRGGFPIWTCPSFFVLQDFFRDFPDLLGDGPGIFPIRPFSLSPPIKSTYQEQSRKGPRHNLDLSRKKMGNPPVWKHPGLASLNFYSAPQKSQRFFCDFFCDFLAIFPGFFWHQNLWFGTLRFENTAIFLRLRFLGTLSLARIDQGRPKHNHNHNFQKKVCIWCHITDATSKLHLMTHRMKDLCIFSVFHCAEGCRRGIWCVIRGYPQNEKWGPARWTQKWVWSWLGRRLIEQSSSERCLQCVGGLCQHVEDKNPRGLLGWASRGVTPHDLC